LIGEHAQMFEKGGKAAGKQADFEDRGKRGGFEKKRNRLTQIVPEVGAFGFVESDELGEFCVRDSSYTSKFARGALADFGIAFHADAKMARIGGKFSLERRGGNFGRIVFSFEEELHQLWAHEINRGGAKRRAFDEVDESERVVWRSKGKDEATARGRSRKSAEVEARDDRERAQRADKELVKVVPGDVLDDAAAAFAEAAGAVDEFCANQEVARGAVRMAKRRVHSGSDDAAHGGFEIKRYGEREKLFLLVERDGKVIEISAGIDADGEVAGVVVGDLVEAGHVEGDVVARRGHADLEFGAVTARN